MVITVIGEAPPGGMTPPGSAPTDLVVEPLSAVSWLVRDRGLPPSNVRSLLGYIEEKDGQFEVMQLDHGFAWFFFDSLTQAAAHFTESRVSDAPLADHVLSWKTTAEARVV